MFYERYEKKPKQNTVMLNGLIFGRVNYENVLKMEKPPKYIKKIENNTREQTPCIWETHKSWRVSFSLAMLHHVYFSGSIFSMMNDRAEPI